MHKAGWIDVLRLLHSTPCLPSTLAMKDCPGGGQLLLRDMLWANMSHGQNSLLEDYITRVLWDPNERATGLHIKSFDHGSYELWSIFLVSQKDMDPIHKI